MDGDEQRAALRLLVQESGVSLAGLSALIGRNPAYLHQYLTRGSPRLLAEADRGALARFFGVPEARLGGPEPAGLVAVPRLDVGASAGPGALVSGEARRTPGAIDPGLLRQLGVSADAASLIRVAGDSMLPTLADGDEILVDGGRRRVDARPALYVLRIDGELMVKRLRLLGREIEVASDNPAWPVRACAAGAAEVIGRVVWLGRALV
ncbi:helix-turn-helix transcriptional regulator [Sphingomonas canadensis]|uniref:Helix-turn-helix transcriptional regulator n=1 Tax=Sphingomonas canadensis TaxID=1219257 RepID=A0ABW3H507_9SPHN|nr:S24 family peptidase [Sphingomonas canadensis]MCW3836119.1 S24 family peptidase [Sphingomonas canadensis]